MVTNILNTTLPIFSGFNSTKFSELVDNYCEFNFDPSNDFEEDGYSIFSFEQYNEARIKISKDIIDDIYRFIPESLKCKIIFKDLIMPRDYNFLNDEIRVDISLDYDELLNLLKKNNLSFKEYIFKNFSNRSGFISYVSNDSSEWLVKYSELKKPESQASEMLQFIMLKEAEKHLNMKLVNNVFESLNNDIYSSISLKY
mgnify:FL=1